MFFASHRWILFVMEFLDMAFPKYVLIYLFGKPIASSYSLELLCMIAWILEAIKNIYLFKLWPLNLTFCHMLICCKIGLQYHFYIPPRNISIYSLSLTSDTHMCGEICRPSSHWLLLWICLIFVAKDLFWSNSHLSSLYILDPCCSTQNSLCAFLC